MHIWLVDSAKACYSSTKFKYSLNIVIYVDKRSHNMWLAPYKGYFWINFLFSLDHLALTSIIFASTIAITVSFYDITSSIETILGSFSSIFCFNVLISPSFNFNSRIALEILSDVEPISYYDFVDLKTNNSSLYFSRDIIVSLCCLSIMYWLCMILYFNIHLFFLENHWNIYWLYIYL